MSHQEHFFLEYMPVVFTSPESTVSGAQCENTFLDGKVRIS